MAVTEFGTNSPQNVLRWSKKLFREAISKTYLGKFLGKDMKSPLCLATDLEEGPGDTIKYDLLMQMEGAGVDGDTRLEGFEEALVFHQDEVKIDQKRNGHAFRTMSQQRSVHELRTLAKKNLGDWFAVKFDRYMLAYLAGTAGTDTRNVAAELPFAGNALEAPDAAHLLDDSGNTFSINMLDHLVEMAKTLDPLIRPCMVDGEEKFVYLAHPYTITEMRTKAGDTEWKMIQARAAERGKSNPIYRNAVGEYAGVIIHESEYIPRTTATPLTHNLFLGAQAGVMAFGNSYKKLGRRTKGRGSYFSWFEKDDDYGNETGIAGGAIFGIKKARFDGADFGCIRHDTADIAHT